MCENVFFAVLGLEVFFALQLFVLSYAVYTFLCLNISITHIICLCCVFNYNRVAAGNASAMFKSARLF